MIDYNPNLENFQDFVDFGPSDPCVWVVYPPGAAGDLIASIINFHYVNTGSKYLGITNSGQTIFRPTDQKKINSHTKSNSLNFNDDFFYMIADSLSQRNLNYSLLDQILFSNHCCKDNQVQLILDSFVQAKIIRITPTTKFEDSVINWLSQYKNFSNYKPLPMVTTTSNSLLPTSGVKDQRLLDIQFSTLFQEHLFEITYLKIIKLLELPGPLIRYNFVDFWLEKHPTDIKNLLKQLHVL